MVMFSVLFMKNSTAETLQGYNQRLGRPQPRMRNEIVGKTKYILGSKSWWDYFDELGVIIKDDDAIDELLRFAIYNSNKNGYHTSYGSIRSIPECTGSLLITEPEGLPEGEGIHKLPYTRALIIDDTEDHIRGPEVSPGGFSKG